MAPPQASQASAPVGETLLPGSEWPLDRAARKADVIAVATISHSERGDPTDPSSVNYQAAIEISRVLKGRLKEGSLSVYFRVRYFTKDRFELDPKEKSSYIFFFRGEKADGLEVIKILADTPENRAAVAQALRPQPKAPPSKTAVPEPAHAGKDERLPGIQKSVEDGAKGAEIIVVATVVKSEVTDSQEPENDIWRGDITIKETLKGETKQTTLSVGCLVEVVHYGEVPPREKGSYIFFLHQIAYKWYAGKIAFDTSENRAAIAKALQAPSVPPAKPKKP